MGAYETKFDYELGAKLPSELLNNSLEKQRATLLGTMLGVIEPNKKYLVELRQDYYESCPENKAGYKAAIYIEEYKGEG